MPGVKASSPAQDALITSLSIFSFVFCATTHSHHMIIFFCFNVKNMTVHGNFTNVDMCSSWFVVGCPIGDLGVFGLRSGSIG